MSGAHPVLVRYGARSWCPITRSPVSMDARGHSRTQLDGSVAFERRLQDIDLAATARGNSRRCRRWMACRASTSSSSNSPQLDRQIDQAATSIGSRRKPTSSTGPISPGISAVTRYADLTPFAVLAGCDEPRLRATMRHEGARTSPPVTLTVPHPPAVALFQHCVDQATRGAGSCCRSCGATRPSRCGRANR